MLDAFFFLNHYKHRNSVKNSVIRIPIGLTWVTTFQNLYFFSMKNHVLANQTITKIGLNLIARKKKRDFVGI